MLIDSHAHLSFDSFKTEEIEGVLARAKEAGVDTIINIGGGEGFEGNLKAVELAEHYPNIFATVGIHPHDAKIVTVQTVEDLKNLMADKKVIAIGEIGLDFFYKHSEPEVQEEAFRKMIRLAKEKKLPIVIHNRDSDDRLYRILEEENGFETGGVVHCFTSTWEFAKKMIDRGFYISFSGIITFKKSEALREVVRKIPTEWYLVETDCPYLAPEPFPGKRNEPAYVRTTAQKIAEVKGLTLEDVARTSALNTRRLFRLGEIEQEPQIAYRIRNSLYLNITNVSPSPASSAPNSPRSR
jgi:TatD DNase family protein